VIAELPKGRYRTNADALLLARFAPRVRGTVFDLGAGVGTIGIELAKTGAQIVLVEKDPDAAALAQKNAADFENVRVMQADVRKAAEANRGKAALVVCNPPYVPLGRGRAPRAEKRDAKMGDVEPFIVAARSLLGRRASACFSYPTTNLVDFLAALRKRGLEPKRMVFVHASPKAPARIALVEVKAAKPGGLVIEAPVYDQAAVADAAT
jgi:tRNA1(Val) A37 N6-methylase TrmN6